MLSYRLAFGPRWRMLAASTVQLGLLMAAIQVFAAVTVGNGRPGVGYAFGAGAVAGLLLGPPLGWLQYRRLAPLRTAIDGRPLTRQACRAVDRGPLPTSEPDRSVTYILIDHTLAEMKRRQVTTAVVASIAAAVGVLFALDGTPWALLISMVGIGFIAWDIRRIKHLGQRRDLMAARPSPQ